MEQPNIFDYATSELSQDAFICYLLTWGKEKYKKAFPREYDLAHKFLKKCGIDEKEEIITVRRQVEHVDVLIGTTKHILIIEDKTYTNEHDDQIVRYVKNMRSHDERFTSDKKIKVCYLKTGDYVRSYKSSNENVLPQNDCCSLRRKDMLELLEPNRDCNLIFENFYRRLDNIEWRIKNCDEAEIRTWCKEKWFDYLSSALSGHDFNIGWVNNARGGFYACYFDWVNCGNGEDYKQIEISFDVTSEVKLCFKFASDSKEITKNSKSLIKELQQKAVAKGYTASNRIGRTTTYAYKTAETKQDILDFINN